MGTGYIQPLAVNFVWHPSDLEIVEPILNVIRISFARDKHKPFSRGLNIPLFFYSSKSSQEVPSNYPADIAKRNIIFVFTSKNTVGRIEWRSYVETLPKSDSINIVPVAIDSHGFNHEGTLSNLQCIRFKGKHSKNNNLSAVVFLAHEIYRFGCNTLQPEDEDCGKRSSIKLFISHSKSDGRKISKKIKNYIDDTNMNRFFDTYEISPGYRFNHEIEHHIQNSTLLAIESDTYSSRYWCQNELLLSKKYNRPVIVVNCLKDYEDRIFPDASNVPCVHISDAKKISKKDILRILSAAIIETVRYNYSIHCLEAYKNEGWIDEDCELSARPPEIRQVISCKKNGVKKICYPEPPVYFIESQWQNDLEVQTFTPLWNSDENGRLSDKRVGISISDVPRDYNLNHIHSDQIVRLAQDFARHLLVQSATLIYGGDLRPGGFTEFILDEAKILKERVSEVNPVVENHLAWPLYQSDKEITDWRARYIDVMNTFDHKIPNDVRDKVPENGVFLNPDTPWNSYIWSRCLSEMREKSINSSTARICVGGKLVGYKGKMPGVLEEILLTFKAQKPIYLLGAYGGVVGDVCKLVLNREEPETLTETWQLEHNNGYSELQELARPHGHNCDYVEVKETILKQSVSELASRSGLDKDEYKRLMKSPFVDECVYLTLKGLKKI